LATIPFTLSTVILKYEKESLLRLRCAPESKERVSP
jgi:hypothetical protein